MSARKWNEEVLAALQTLTVLTDPKFIEARDKETGHNTFKDMQIQLAVSILNLRKMLGMPSIPTEEKE